jgi:hypothetical protein
LPSRIVRDGLLDSERVACLHDKTFRLYISLLLTADDFGLVEVGFGQIKRANAIQEWSREMVAKMLGELTDAGLILPYSAEGKQFAAIARWQTRVNCVRPRHPEPSFGMGHMLRPYEYKSLHVRDVTSKYFRHLDTNSVPPVSHEWATSGRKGEGLRVKGEGIKEKGKVKNITSPAAPSDVSPQVWGDWQSLRKAKRAAVTATAVAGIRKEAESIGMSLEDALSMCCERGWTGFKAEWVSKQAAAADKYAAQAARVIKLLDGEVFDAKP